MVPYDTAQDIFVCDSRAESHFQTEIRVRFHNLKFIIGERAGLVQDCHRYFCLPQVVHHAADDDFIEIVTVVGVDAIAKRPADHGDIKGVRESILVILLYFSK